MNTKEKQELLERYMQMPEEELSEMLTINENEYENGIYQLLLEAAKSRGLGTEKKEIIDKASSLQQKAKEKIASELLTPKQKIIFTIFPGLAFWYSIFAPKEWKQRQREANRCQWVGLRNYFVLGLVCGIFLLFTLNENQITPEDKANLIFTCIWVTLGIIGISVYLHFQNKKQNKKPITKQSSGR